MDRAASFARVVPLLGDRVVVRYDRRGYGRSLAAGPGTIEDHAADLLGVIDSYAGGAAVVVGHSIGGVIALAAASARPAAVLAVGAFEAPMPWLPSWESVSAGGDAVAVADAEGTGAAAERFMRRMVGDERWEAMPAEDRQRRRAEGDALVAELRSVRAGGPPYDLAAVTVPVRAARGSRSKPHHRAAAEELARLVGAGEPTEIEGAQHGAHASHPDAFAAWVRSIPT
jgi:pimeloyl-ACP methyl ester carboxylesterase